MASDLDICNLALAKLGQNPISNLLNPATFTEQLCSLHFPIARDAVVESADWSFAMTRAVVTAQAMPAPAWGFSYRLAEPADSLRLIWAGNTIYERQPSDFIWQREGNFIVCNSETVYLRYIRRITDPSQFHALVVYAIAAKMALEMCMPITENLGLQNQLMGEYGRKLSEAMNYDGLQGSSQMILSNTLTSMRV